MSPTITAARPRSAACWENYLLLPRANVMYFDGSYFQPVAKNLIVANGIAVSRDGAHIYVAEMMGRTIFSYKRNPFSGALTEDGSLPVPTSPDNIDVADDGALWVAGHPRVLDVMAYQGNAAKPSPSQISARARGGRRAASGRARLCERGRRHRRGQRRRGVRQAAFHRLDARPQGPRLHDAVTGA